MTYLLKTTSVLDRHTLLDKSAQQPLSQTFIQRDEETGLATRFVTLLVGDWEDLGRPDRITVSIEPGDTLND